MTEIPEHLLKRAQEARAKKGDSEPAAEPRPGPTGGFIWTEVSRARERMTQPR